MTPPAAVWRPRGRLPWSALVGALLLAVVLSACGSSNVLDDSGESWVAQGNTCVRQSEEQPRSRVINYVDPELCGRSVAHRSPVYVRIVPPPGMRSQ